MSFKQKHIKENFNFNDVNIQTENVLASYYYDQLITVFKQFYYKCNKLEIVSTSSGTLALKNHFDENNTMTLLYIIPVNKNGKECFDIKIPRFKKSDDSLLGMLIGVSDITKLVVKLSEIIPINMCLLHLPGNMAPGFEFDILGNNYDWVDIKYLVRHHIKIAIDNYVFHIKNSQIAQYIKRNYEHYEHYSTNGSIDSVRSDFRSIFFPLIDSDASKPMNTREKAFESVDFNSITTSNDIGNKFSNEILLSGIKQHLNDDNLFVAGNDNCMFIKTCWDGEVETLIYIVSKESGKKDIIFTKNFARYFDKITNGSPDMPKAYAIDSCVILYILDEIMNIFGKGSINRVKIKIPENTRKNIRFESLNAQVVGKLLYSLIVDYDVHFLSIVSPIKDCGANSLGMFYINIDSLFPTFTKTEQKTLVSKMLQTRAPFTIGYIDLYNFNHTYINENLDFNVVQQTINNMYDLENLIPTMLNASLPEKYRTQKLISVSVDDFDNIKWYRIYVEVNGTKYLLARLIFVDYGRNRLQINDDAMYKIIHIWDKTYEYVINFLLNIPVDIDIIQFEARVKSKLPKHFSLLLLDINTLYRKNISIQYKPFVDFHYAKEYMEQHNMTFNELKNMLDHCFDTYKFNDNERFYERQL